MTTRIAFIGFGEAGQSFGSSLIAAGATISAYDILVSAAPPATEWRARAGTIGARLDPDARTAVADAAFVISAVTAESALAAAEATAPLLQPDQCFIDINSVAPSRKQAAASAVTAAGARYLDMAVMGPVHPRGHRTPVLIAGPEAVAIAPRLEALGFGLSVAGDAVGAATAIKMVRSVFMKGFEAIMAECLVAAEKAGVADAVLASLADTYPGLDWARLPGYQIERMARHGVRRAAEMREVCATLADLGLAPVMSAATMAAQQAVGDLALARRGVALDDYAALVDAVAPAFARASHKPGADAGGGTSSGS
ncbi:MAG: DUF1932 domain-containing protein [Azospirillaceae bacterium]